MVRRIANFTAKKDQPKEPDFSLVATEVDDLILKTREILRREILNLMGESTGGKLSPTSSMALTNYIKLLNELRADELKELEKLGNDHLEALAGDDIPEES